MPLFSIETALGINTNNFDSGLDASARKADSAMGLIAGSAKRYLGTAGLLYSFQQANKQAMEFGQMMADISAITELNVDKMSKSLLKLDNILGKPDRTGYTLYETISSGIKGTEEDLLHFVEVAGKTAKVIRADVYSTSNALTTMMHAYGVTAAESGKLMDFFYTTVKEGKAHGEELARTYGLVVNNAHETGIALNDLGAAVATLSRTMTTSNAMISLNQMMNSFLGPTEEAKRTAKEFGIEMDVETIKTKGFADVMRQVHERVGGNVEAIKSLFGNIRAARGALVLTGSQYKNFVDVLNEFETSSGNAEIAFKKQTETVKASAERFWTAWNKVQIGVGDDIGGLTKAFYKIGESSLDGFRTAGGAIGEFFDSVGLKMENHPFLALGAAIDKQTASLIKYAFFVGVAAKAVKGIFSAGGMAFRALEVSDIQNKQILDERKLSGAGMQSVGGAERATTTALRLPTTEFNTQVASLEKTFIQALAQVKSMGVAANKMGISIQEVRNALTNVLEEFAAFNRQNKIIAKQLITLSKQSLSVSESVTLASKIMTDVASSTTKLSSRLSAFSVKMSEIASSITVVNREVGKADTSAKKMQSTLSPLLANLNGLSSTMSASLKEVAGSIAKTNSSFARAVQSAILVNQDAINLELRLAELHRALKSKYPGTIARSSRLVKHNTESASTKTIVSDSTPEPITTPGKSAKVSQTNPPPILPGRGSVSGGSFRDFGKNAVIVPLPSGVVTKTTADSMTSVRPSIADLRRYEASLRPPMGQGLPNRPYGWDMTSIDRKLLPAPSVLQSMVAQTAATRPVPVLNAPMEPQRSRGWHNTQTVPGNTLEMARRMTAKNVRIQQTEGLTSAMRGLDTDIVTTSTLMKKGAEDIAKGGAAIANGGTVIGDSALSFKGVGAKLSGAVSAIGNAGMWLFGSITAAQLGWSIGKQIAEKFKFSESKFFMTIADVMVGKSPGSTAEQIRSLDEDARRSKADLSILKINSMVKSKKITPLEGDRFLATVNSSYGMIATDASARLDNLYTRLIEIEKLRVTQQDKSTQAIKSLIAQLAETEVSFKKAVEENADPTTRVKYTENERKEIIKQLRAQQSKAQVDYADIINEPAPISYGDYGLQSIPESYVKAPQFAVRESEALGAFDKLIRMIGDAKEPITSELIGKMFARDGGSLLTNEGMSKVMQTAGLRLAPGASEQQREKEALQDVQNAKIALITSQSIERAKKIQSLLGDAIVDNVLSEVEAAVKYGLDSSQVLQLKADYNEGVYKVRQGVFFKLQKDIADLESSDIWKSLDDAGKKSATFVLRKDYTEAYKAMLDAMEAASTSANRAVDATIAELSAQTQTSLDAIAFTPADSMTPAMYQKKAKAVEKERVAISDKIEQMQIALQDLTETSITRLYDAEKKILDDEIAQLNADLNVGNLPPTEKTAIEAALKESKDRLRGLSEKSVRAQMEKNVSGKKASINTMISRKQELAQESRLASIDVHSAIVSVLEGRKRSLGAQRSLGTVSEGQYTQGMLNANQALQNAYSAMLASPDLAARGTEDYRKSADALNSLKIESLELTRAFGSLSKETRGSLFNTIQGMTSGGKMDNNVLHHAIQLLGMAGGPAILQRFTSPGMSMEGGSNLNRAQQAQSALASSMDAYIMSQRYEQANVGTTVTKIYDFISRNNAIILR